MNIESIDQMRPLTAWRLLELWRKSREETEDPLERTLLCNARILAESCFSKGEAFFLDEQAVLAALTGRQMEQLLRRLAAETDSADTTENPAFDWARFRSLEA